MLATRIGAPAPESVSIEQNSVVTVAITRLLDFKNGFIFVSLCAGIDRQVVVK